LWGLKSRATLMLSKSRTNELYSQWGIFFEDDLGDLTVSWLSFLSRAMHPYPVPHAKWVKGLHVISNTQNRIESFHCQYPTTPFIHLKTFSKVILEPISWLKNLSRIVLTWGLPSGGDRIVEFQRRWSKFQWIQRFPNWHGHYNHLEAPSNLDPGSRVWFSTSRVESITAYLRSCDMVMILP
jgi:hypothetical protein